MQGSKYIVYNPYAKNGRGKEEAEILEVIYENAVMIDILKICNYEVFFRGLEKEDSIILCGGDGTLNSFVNATRGIKIENDIYFNSIGNDFDFIKDLDLEWGAVPDFRVNPYIKNLPSLMIEGEEKLFINGVDFESRQVKERLSAAIFIDGSVYRYNNVRFVATLNGRFYNKGMRLAPQQERLGETNLLTTVVVHDCSWWKFLRIYRALRKGTHEKYKKNVETLIGKKVKVFYEKPISITVDGTEIQSVTEYEMRYIKEGDKKYGKDYCR